MKVLYFRKGETSPGGPTHYIFVPERDVALVKKSPADAPGSNYSITTDSSVLGIAKDIFVGSGNFPSNISGVRELDLIGPEVEQLISCATKKIDLERTLTAGVDDILSKVSKANKERADLLKKSTDSK